MEPLFENEVRFTMKMLNQLTKNVKSIMAKIIIIVSVVAFTAVAIFVLMVGSIAQALIFIVDAAFLAVFYFVFLPHFTANRTYKSCMVQTNNNEFTTQTGFFEDYFVVKNTFTGSEMKYKYDKIRNISRSKDYVFLVLDMNVSVVVDKNAFKKGNIDDFMDFIKAKVVK